MHTFTHHGLRDCCRKTLQAGCPSQYPTKSVKALRKQSTIITITLVFYLTGLFFSKISPAGSSKVETLEIVAETGFFLQAGCPSCRPTNRYQAWYSDIQLEIKTLYVGRADTPKVFFFCILCTPFKTNIQSHTNWLLATSVIQSLEYSITIIVIVVIIIIDTVIIKLRQCYLWHTHFEAIVSKATQRLYFLKQLKRACRGAPRPAHSLLYFSHPSCPGICSPCLGSPPHQNSDL